MPYSDDIHAHVLVPYLGLKKFSNWPTYPQLYINGELVGGLDIVKVNLDFFFIIALLYICSVHEQEMNESGELDSMLPKARSLDDR